MIIKCKRWNLFECLLCASSNRTEPYSTFSHVYCNIFSCRWQFVQNIPLVTLRLLKIWIWRASNPVTQDFPHPVTHGTFTSCWLCIVHIYVTMIVYNQTCHLCNYVQNQKINDFVFWYVEMNVCNVCLLMTLTLTRVSPLTATLFICLSHLLSGLQCVPYWVNRIKTV